MRRQPLGELVEVGAPAANGVLAILRPRWLGPGDIAWVAALCCAVDGLAGLRRSDAEIALGDLALPPSAGGCGPLRHARRTVEDLVLTRRGFLVDAPVEPARLRALTFGMSAGLPEATRHEVLAAVSATAGDLLPHDWDDAWLYADLPSERRLRSVPSADDEAGDGERVLVPEEIVQLFNLRLLQRLLRRAGRLRVTIREHLAPVLRFARLQRLLFELRSEPGATEVVIDLSGPLSLFRQTTKYGNAMANWIPMVTRTPRWSLRAQVALGDARGRCDGLLEVDHTAPLRSARGPLPAVDSKLEAAFLRDLQLASSEWLALRETSPERVGRTLVCPDFTLVNPFRELRIPVEIVGFWTPEYLAAKVALARALAAAGRPWVLCVDRRLGVAADLDVGPHDVFVFDRAVDVPAFLAFIESREERWRQATRRACRAAGKRLAPSVMVDSSGLVAQGPLQLELALPYTGARTNQHPRRSGASVSAR